MTPIEFAEAGIKLYGRKHWANELAKALAVNSSTIRRLLKHDKIPGVYEVAIRGLLQHKRASDIIRRADKKKHRLLAMRLTGDKRRNWKAPKKPKVKQHDDIEDLAKRGLAKPGVDYSNIGVCAPGAHQSAGTRAGPAEAPMPDDRPVPDPVPDPGRGEDAGHDERGA